MEKRFESVFFSSIFRSFGSNLWAIIDDFADFGCVPVFADRRQMVEAIARRKFGERNLRKKEKEEKIEEKKQKFFRF